MAANHINYNNFLKEESDSRQPRSTHAWRAETPGILWHLGLTPLQRDLYTTLKKITGDEGCCFMSIPTLSKFSGHSERDVQYILKHLQKPFDLLNGKSLIKITKRKKQNGSWDTNLITVNDIWQENEEYFKSKKQDLGGATHAPGMVQHLHQDGAPVAYKEEPIKKNTLEESSSSPPPKKTHGEESFEKWKKRMISFHCKEEEFEEAWKRFMKTQCGEIKNIRKWLIKVIESLRDESPKKKELQDLEKLKEESEKKNKQIQEDTIQLKILHKKQTIERNKELAFQIDLKILDDKNFEIKEKWVKLMGEKWSGFLLSFEDPNFEEILKEHTLKLYKAP
jgi:hypothetical protein